MKEKGMKDGEWMKKRGLCQGMGGVVGEGSD